jgi:hypothetical protein
VDKDEPTRRNINVVTPWLNVLYIEHSDVELKGYSKTE